MGRFLYVSRALGVPARVEMVWVITSSPGPPTLRNTSRNNGRRNPLDDAPRAAYVARGVPRGTPQEVPQGAAGHASSGLCPIWGLCFVGAVLSPWPDRLPP